MAIADVGEANIWYETEGEGPSLILASGLGGNASFWQPNMAFLRQHFSVLRFDHRGTGESSRNEQRYSVELLAEDLLKTMDAAGIRRASLIGHSTGGAMGQVLAAIAPERIDKLVLYSSWATLCPQMRLCMELRQAVLRSQGNDAYHKIAPLFLYPPQFICEQWDAVAAGIALSAGATTTDTILDARMQAVIDFDGTPYMNKICAPTLVMVARDDILTPRFAADELHARIPGATLQVMDYGAHSFSQTTPERFNQAVFDFLKD